MAFLPETRERFLREIAARIAPDRVIEIYFFAPIRQGGVESGVAVIAAEPEQAARPEDAAGSAEPRVDRAAAGLADAGPPPDEPPAAAVLSELVDDVADDPPPSEIVVQQEIFVEPDSGARAGAPAAPPRYTVYTAKYRLVLKGLDRGKWESRVVAEADAPLLTIETVVRGVQRRSGDTDDPERMSGDDVRNALGTLVGQRA